MNRQIRIVLGVCLFVFGLTHLSAQFTINSHNTGWVLVNGSHGTKVTGLLVIQMQINGDNNYNNWSIVTRVKSPIRNGENKEFPVDKLGFKFNSYTTNFPNIPIPTTNQLGIIHDKIKASFTPVYLIKNSPYSIQTPEGSYRSIRLVYDVEIEGGNYLNALKSWSNYNINLDITLLTENGTVLSTNTVPLEMQISPNGNYEPVADFTIALSSGATSADLVFRSIGDYVNGVQKDYPNALQVKSEVPYEVQISSLSPHLISNNNTVLDVNLLQVQLQNTATNQWSSQVSLSSVNQTLWQKTTSNNSDTFNIRYSSNPPEEKIMNTPTGVYTTTLLYTISPL